MRARAFLLLTFVFLVGCSSYEEECVKSVRIIDGDTILTNNGAVVRLVGIDAPEKGMPYSKIASDELGRFLDNNCLTLEKDVSETDKYGRTLRYIYVDNESVNEHMINEGLAVAFAYGNDTRYAERFNALQENAKKNKLGMWSGKTF
ncbi:thermonuclease family protein [Candidatus Woesearchaeota archaeon]|nr:thermonuclease family protein [Candidatus Woesearchaeota archaeon]